MQNAIEQFDFIAHQAVYARRHYLSQILREKTRSVVQYGILAGYELGPANWAEAAVGSYILGQYEVQICALLDMLKWQDRVFIDVGAADGLYGIGLISVGAYKRSVCFEAEEVRSRGLHETVSRLGLEERVDVRGTADAELIRQAAKSAEQEGGCAVVLCDIEGAEFELFDDALLEALSGHYVIIETHPFLFHEGEEAYKSLFEDASRHFQVYEICDGLRYLPQLPLLADWNDSDVWMTCMEGRHRMMRWLYLAPKGSDCPTPEAIMENTYGYLRRMYDEVAVVIGQK